MKTFIVVIILILLVLCFIGVPIFLVWSKLYEWHKINAAKKAGLWPSYGQIPTDADVIALWNSGHGYAAVSLCMKLHGFKAKEAEVAVQKMVEDNDLVSRSS